MDELRVTFTDEARAAIEQWARELHEPPEAVLEAALGLLVKIAATLQAGGRVLLERNGEQRELVFPLPEPAPARATG